MKILRRVTGPVAVNTYLVINEERAEGVLVDPGGDAEALEELIARERIAVKAILLTHGHFDHIGACAHFQRRGIPVYMPIWVRQWGVPSSRCTRIMRLRTERSSILPE